MALRTRILIPLLLLALAPILSAHARIVGGRAVAQKDPHAASTVALLTVQPDGRVGICTASIIASDLLITAAHCVTNKYAVPADPRNVYVIFNVGVSEGIADRRQAKGLIPHPSYLGIFETSETDQNDIAVVRFSGGLPEGYKPATLLSHSKALPAGASTTLIGYGVDQQSPDRRIGGSGSGTLRKVTVQIQDGKFAKTEILLDQREGRGACHGDSGGPAVVTIKGKSYLWGVTSRGYPENAPDDCKHFSVYTRITSHTAFVNQAIKALRKP